MRHLTSRASPFSMTVLPASFTPVFLSSELSQTISVKSASQSQQCCTGNGCFYSTPYSEETCQGCDPVDRLAAASCSDPFGSCWQPIYTSIRCRILETGEEYLCLVVEFTFCGSPAPTPTPYPTPDPFPTPEPSPSPDATPCPSLVCADPNAVPASSCPDFLGSHCPAGYSQEGKVLTSICDGRISDFV
jgi:hypothetical protein